MTTTIPADLAERSEAEAYFDFGAGAPAPVKAKLGMDSRRLGGGVALSMRNDPTGFWSKTLGLGFTEPVTAELIEEVCGYYRSQDSPGATLQLAPSVLPEHWPEICAKANLTGGGSYVKLICAIEDFSVPAESAAAGLRIEPVTSAQAETWGSVMVRGFGMPEDGLAPMVASAVGRPDWHPFAAWDGTELVATGSVHLLGDAAQIFGGATLGHARRRGGQTALLAARAQAAREAGCRWLVAETGAEAPGEHNSSLRNMLRTGFSVLYERRNWHWTPDAA